MADAKPSRPSKPAAEVAEPKGPSRPAKPSKTDSVEYVKEGSAVYRVTKDANTGKVLRARIDGPNGELPEGVEV